MWRWIFVNLLVFSSISTQPILDHDGRECCPCPKPADMAPAAASLARANFDDCPCRANAPWSNANDGFPRVGGEDQELAGTAGEGAFIRPGVVDDCPCRVRDADSVGSPSVFFPSAVRALWPDVSDKEKKEDAKPLLHPEVGLASSVLETLRQATDEEYEEALARDAVRSAIQAPDVDVMNDVSSALDTARNIVNVILKPNDSRESIDDSDSEASHVHESRCIHPLGRSNTLNLQNSPTTVNKIFTLPKKEPVALLHKNRNIWDIDSSVGASDVHEQIIDGTGRGFEGLKLKSNPSLFSLFPGKSNDEPVKQFKLLKDNKKMFTNFKEAENIESPLDALNRQIDNSISDLKLKIDDHLQTIKSDHAIKLKNAIDSVNSPSTPNIAFKPLVATKKLELTTAQPFSLKSLLKLKDVEFVPPIKTFHNDLNSAKVKVPKKESTIDLFKNFKTADLGDIITKGLKIGFENNNIQGGSENILPIRKGIFKSEIIDADTSPSETHENIDHDVGHNNICKENIKDSSLNLSQSTKNTDILEKLPKSSKINDEPINNNIHDFPETVNNMPNTEIMDTVPNSSNINPVLFNDDDLNNTPDGFRKISRDEAESNSGINSDENSESFFVNNSQEDDREDGNGDDFSETNLDDINVPDESDVEEREQDSEKNCLVESMKQDSEPETTNNSPNILEPEDESLSDLNPKVNNDDANEPCADEKLDLDTEHEGKNTDFKRIKPLFTEDSRSALKDEIIRKLEKFKKPQHKITMKNNKDAINDNNNIQESITANEECDGIENTVSKSVKVIEPEKKSEKSLDIIDLQNMSDKLLDKSNKRDQKPFASEDIECNISPNIQTVSNEIPDPTEEVDNTKTSQNVDSTEDNDNVSETSNIFENIDKSDKSVEQENTCESILSPKSNPVFNENDNNEMSADGSDPLINKVSPEKDYKTSLLHNILHPKDLNIGNNLKRTDSELRDILNLKLPKLHNVRENLASILEPKNNMGFSTAEEKSFAEDSNTMSVDASAPTFKSVLPTLRPLEDIHLDIFQLKPLTLPNPHELLSKVPTLPRLNLNSYKAKLAVPKGLNIKPMKLESSLGGKNGLFGATLSVGSDKGPFEKWPTFLGGPTPFNNLPTLEELHSNMKESAQNFLGTPLDITGRNIIDDSLRSSQTLTDNLRSHAKNTMKDIQQTLQTSLKDVEQSDLSILANPLRDPQEFFQALSRTHEDVTDKLKAIHYDFNDRLESIRDRINDQSLLPSLNAPMMRQSSFTFGPEKLMKKPLISTSYSRPQKKLKATSKSRPQSNSKLSSSRTKPGKSKSIKMPAAHSVPVPKTVQAPKLKTVATSSPPPFVLKHSSFRPSTLMTNKKSITDILPEPVSRFRDSKIPLLGRYKPENKVKISFGTTTLRPELSANKPSLASEFNNRPSVPKKPIFSPKISTPKKIGAPRLSTKLIDTKEAPSEMVSTKLTAPAHIEKLEKKPSLTIPKKPLPELPRPKLLLNKSKTHINGRFTNGQLSKPASSIDKQESELENLADPSKLGAPKNLDILASLREAVRARLSNITPISNDKIVQPDSSFVQPDMLRSASENVESTNVDGVMRENASYTCKMVCTRNN